MDYSGSGQVQDAGCFDSGNLLLAEKLLDSENDLWSMELFCFLVPLIYV